MLFEVIEKNKRKSIIALIGSIVLYSLVSAPFCAVLIAAACAFFINKFNLNLLYILCTLGFLASLGLFWFVFSSEKNKPYKFRNCSIHKIDRFKNQKLYNIVHEISIAAGLQNTPQIYIINSNIFNAYACGINPKNASIAVSKGLVEILLREELQGIIAHEMSHIVNRDTMYLLCSGILLSIVSDISKSLGIIRNEIGNMVKNFSLIRIIILTLTLYILFTIIYALSILIKSTCGFLFKFISKEREYLADACAVLYTRNPEALASAMRKIEEASKNNIYQKEAENANPLIKASFFAPVKGDNTHPDTESRIKILEEMKSADFNEYERIYEKLYNKKLLPKSALANCSSIPLNLSAPHAGEVPHSGKGGVKK